MILIQWLKFLFLIYNFIFVIKLHFLTFVLIYDYVFPIYDLHSYSIFFLKNILSSSSFLFFPSSYSFTFSSFFLISHLPFFFFPYFSLFFFFSQFASFPQFGLPFPKSAAPVLPHFLLPWLYRFFNKVVNH